MSEKIKDLEGEIWKDIEGYEGYYQISNKGRLKSKLRSVNGKLNSTLTLNPRLYKGYIDKKGYVRYSLSREHKMVRIFSHVLVAKHFIPNLENKPQINHKNGIKTNNRVENLEWCTCKENVNHAHRTNLIKLKTGEDHCNSFLTNQQVIDIREELSQYSVINLAKNTMSIQELLVL